MSTNGSQIYPLEPFDETQIEKVKFANLTFVNPENGRIYISKRNNELFAFVNSSQSGLSYYAFTSSATLATEQKLIIILMIISSGIAIIFAAVMAYFTVKSFQTAKKAARFHEKCT